MSAHPTPTPNHPQTTNPTMRKSASMWLLPLLTVIIIAAFLFRDNKQNVAYQHDKGFIFGTVYSISYRSDSSLHDGIRREMERVDNSLSMFNEGSTISRINRNETATPDSMLRNIFRLAMTVSAETDGAFDITVAPLVNAWGFGFKNGIHPTPQAIDSLRQTIGYDKIALIGDSITKADERVMLDCGAIAKGYGCDVVADYLRSKGIEDFMVEIGGEIVASGESEHKKAWRVGVSKPSDDTLATDSKIEAILSVSNMAMATSGNYRNFYYKDGRKYAHTIDPRTGYPVQHNILSATVLAENCATADAYATAFMVTGLDGARKILERHPELAAYIIYSDSIGNNAVWHSPRIDTLINR